MTGAEPCASPSGHTKERHLALRQGTGILVTFLSYLFTCPTITNTPHMTNQALPCLTHTLLAQTGYGGREPKERVRNKRMSTWRRGNGRHVEIKDVDREDGRPKSSKDNGADIKLTQLQPVFMLISAIWWASHYLSFRLQNGTQIPL